MLNPINFISKLFKSSNEKELLRIKKIVSKINLLEDNFKSPITLDQILVQPVYILI